MHEFAVLVELSPMSRETWRLSAPERDARWTGASLKPRRQPRSWHWDRGDLVALTAAISTGAARPGAGLPAGGGPTGVPNVGIQVFTASYVFYAPSRVAAAVIFPRADELVTRHLAHHAGGAASRGAAVLAPRARDHVVVAHALAQADYEAENGDVASKIQEDEETRGGGRVGIFGGCLRDEHLVERRGGVQHRVDDAED